MAYLVLTENEMEGVMFVDNADALFAATGNMEGWSCATLGDAFRQAYAYDEPEKQFRMIEIEVPNLNSTT